MQSNIKDVDASWIENIRFANFYVTKYNMLFEVDS